MTHWLRRGADGWRLDAAYAVPDRFWAQVLPRVRERVSRRVVRRRGHPRRLLGAGDDSRASTPSPSTSSGRRSGAASTTATSTNSTGRCVRHNEFLDDFVPMTFVGNHDVTRIASQLENTRHLEHALVILFTTGGTPSVYAGDESAYRGIKEERFGGDDAVRPEFTAPLMGVDEHGHDVFRLHQYLIGLRRRHPWLHAARTSPRSLDQHAVRLRDPQRFRRAAGRAQRRRCAVVGVAGRTRLRSGPGRRGVGRAAAAVVGDAEVAPHGWLIIASVLSSSTVAGSSSPAVKLVQHRAKVGVVVGRVGEQRHRRAHLQVVGPAEDRRRPSGRRSPRPAACSPAAAARARRAPDRPALRRARRCRSAARSRCVPAPAVAGTRTRSNGCVWRRCAVRPRTVS